MHNYEKYYKEKYSMENAKEGCYYVQDDPEKHSEKVTFEQNEE